MFALFVSSNAIISTKKARAQKNTTTCSEPASTCRATLPTTMPSARPLMSAVLGQEATQVAGWSQFLMRYDPKPP